MIFRALWLLFLFAFVASAEAAVPTQDMPVAVLRVLDKVTARVEEVEAETNKTVTFGTLLVTPRACRASLPEETPEAASFLEIGELKPGHPDAPVFRGWMFASSPALSAMEHPVYDIWLIGCKSKVSTR